MVNIIFKSNQRSNASGNQSIILRGYVIKPSTVKYWTTIQFDNRISLCMYMLHYSIEGYSRWQSRKHTKRSTDGKVTLSCPPQPILLSLPVLTVSMICTCVYVYLYRHSMDHRSVQYCSYITISAFDIHCGSWPCVYGISTLYWPGPGRNKWIWQQFDSIPPTSEWWIEHADF